MAFIAPFQFRTNVAQSVFPLTLCYVGMLVFNNICLQYVEVTFYQVTRTPPTRRPGSPRGVLLCNADPAEAAEGSGPHRDL